MKHCLECGVTLKNTKTATFCSRVHKMRFHNRRRDRGAELYDIFMTMRFDRAKAKKHKLWSVLCSVASAYRESDNKSRAGRRSWDSDAYRRIPLAFSSGDRR